ncbi:MAG: flagellar FliJ family protein [Alphaproteobacteria bacterium]|nr:flagellar FliJ family protein [Alphaproteobacteria bacterium]
MAKKLKTLIRLNKWTVDERRRELGQLLAREDELRTLLAVLEQDLLDEQKTAAEDPTLAGFTYGGYAQRYLDNKAKLLRLLAALAKEILAAQERLAEAYRALKTVEEVEKTRAKKELEEANRKEQKMLDEIASTRHQRAKEGN